MNIPPPTMAPELKIVLDVARFRLRRLEMANLAATAALMLALRLDTLEFAIRFGFAALLNLLVYLHNDYVDSEADARELGRDVEKTSFLRAHRTAAMRAQAGMAGLLVAFAIVWGGGLLQAGLLGAAICGAYSLVLKRRPGLDVLSMIAWGAAMPMIGVPPGRPEGLWLVGQLALFSGVFESIQVMRDHDTDRLSNIPTTAVVLGIPMTRQLTRWLVLVAGIYAMAAFHPALGVLMMVALVLPIPEGDLRSYWNRMRALLGLTFLVECALVYTAGGS